MKAPFLPSRPAPSSQATMTITPSIDITVGNLHQKSSAVVLPHERTVRELAKTPFTLNGMTSLPRITVDKMVFSATYTLQLDSVFSTNQDKQFILKNLIETLTSCTNWEENTPYPRGLIYGGYSDIKEKEEASPKPRFGETRIRKIGYKVHPRKDYQPHYCTGRFPGVFSHISPGSLTEPTKPGELPKQLHLPAKDEKSFDQNHYLHLYEYLDKDGVVIHCELKWTVNIFCNPQRALYHHPGLSTEWGNTPEGAMRSFYRNPDIESDKDNIIPEDMSQDSFIKGMKNACAGVLQIAYESLINAVNETRMKEFVCNGYLPWERALSKGDIKLVETDWAFPCNDAPCFISSLRKAFKSTAKKVIPRNYGKDNATDEPRNGVIVYCKRGVELSIYAESLNMIRAELRQKGNTGFKAYKIDGYSMATYVYSPVFEMLMERVFLAMRSAHQALNKVIKSIHPFEFKDPQEDPSGFIAWMWQIESREKYKETVQEIIKWIISGCDLHADNLSENAKKLLRRHVDKKNFLAKSKTFYPFF